jgi:hypothetical protein
LDVNSLDSNEIYESLSIGEEESKAGPALKAEYHAWMNLCSETELDSVWKVIFTRISLKI